jgi:DegV family protein with EDD domain
VPLYVNFKEGSIKETEIDPAEFYEKILKEGIPTSSQPSLGDFYQVMRPLVEKNHPLVGVFISSKMSGTYYSALQAREMLINDFPQAKIEIIDSGSNSMQLGLAVLEGARASSEGRPFEQVVEAVKECLKRTRYLFAPETLKYLQLGGRIGRASTILGSILQIVPVLTVENGIVEVVAKVRTKKKAVEAMLEKLYEDHLKYKVLEVTVHHINVYEEAVRLADLISKRLKLKPQIVEIGPVVGIHVGPGAVGFVYRTERLLR